jgi:hypothetical protein
VPGGQSPTSTPSLLLGLAALVPALPRHHSWCSREPRELLSARRSHRC